MSANYFITSNMLPNNDIMWSSLSNTEVIAICMAIIESKLYQSEVISNRPRRSHLCRGINSSELR